MTNQEILNQIHRGVIVSCQALPDEPLYGYHFMGHLAFAAKEGGAVGIRANTCEDIVDIKKEVDLPVIGIIKSVYDDSDVYITPTMKEIDALAATGVEIIALDATDRPRPNGLDLDTLFKEARAKYPNQLFMADCSCYEDCKHAAEIGFDLVGTTLCGYTAKTKGTAIPDYDLLSRITTELNRSSRRAVFGSAASCRRCSLTQCTQRLSARPSRARVTSLADLLRPFHEYAFRH